MANTELEVKNLKKYFNTSGGMLHAVDDVSFNIERGKTLGVVGESGCGKSTLGRTVLNVLPATGGNIIFEGKDITKYNHRQMKEVRKDMQLIFQDPYSSLNPRMTVSEIIAEPVIINKLAGKDLNKYINKYMDMVGLAASMKSVYPHELDGGRRQRIGIARALVLEPKFIVCDEPVSALDVSIQAQILNLLMDLQEEMGLTYMFITHDMSVVKHISDEIIVMYLGKVIEKAKSSTLFENPIHPYTRALLSAIPIPSIKYRDMEIKPIKGEVSSPISPKPGCRFISRCPIASEECGKNDIELRDIENGHSVACVKY